MCNAVGNRSKLGIIIPEFIIDSFKFLFRSDIKHLRELGIPFFYLILVFLYFV